MLDGQKKNVDDLADQMGKMNAALQAKIVDLERKQSDLEHQVQLLHPQKETPAPPKAPPKEELLGLVVIISRYLKR